jgi:protein-S-isoprenylcysteine O-methyltransferase Ste14
MFVCLFLVRPSFAMILLTLLTIAVFHLLVLKEENHLMSIHGKDYEEYQKTTGRYLPLF